MGYLNKGNEAKALDEYLKLRPNLKTRDILKIFVQFYLGDILIEGFIKAGWEPS